jgi:hypothetical protein
VGRLRGEHLPLPVQAPSSPSAKGSCPRPTAGASFHYNIPSNYGDLHAGFYNGENYNRQEANDQKAFIGARHGQGRSPRVR